MTDPYVVRAMFDAPLQIERVGSRATCDPAPTDTDEDFLVLVCDVDAEAPVLAALGFDTTTDLDYIGPNGERSQFVSFKRGDLNLLVTADGDFHKAFMAATHVAKRLNLMKKRDRVMLFQAVLYRECAA